MSAAKSVGGRLGWAALLCLLAAAPPGRAAGANETVVMAPYVVKTAGDYFDFHILYAEETERVVSVRVTWVGPLLQKAGLATGDTLEAVDDRPVREFARDQLYHAIVGDIATGRDRRFSFLVHRGFFGRTQRLTFVMGGKAPTPPALAPGSREAPPQR